jgi:hypothetical protein
LSVDQLEVHYKLIKLVIWCHVVNRLLVDFLLIVVWPLVYLVRGKVLQGRVFHVRINLIFFGLINYSAAMDSVPFAENQEGVWFVYQYSCLVILALYFTNVTELEELLD